MDGGVRGVRRLRRLADSRLRPDSIPGPSPTFLGSAVVSARSVPEFPGASLAVLRHGGMAGGLAAAARGGHPWARGHLGAVGCGLVADESRAAAVDRRYGTVGGVLRV